MANQNWNPYDYGKSADFVPILGRPVIELLAPRPGEKILDLACGNGTLTKELMDAGVDVIGVDASPEMVEAAKANGVHAILLRAEHMTFHEEFDAVMSNAALHWMSDQYAVVRSVWNALKPGGRFAAECGGEGCVRIIREGMKIALIKRNIDYKARNPWKYPELGPFQKILENQGFKVSYIARIDRPTPLPNGLKGWLEVFSNSHTQGFTEIEKEKFYAEVEDYCRPFLYDEKTSTWIADYVRLRFLAQKDA
ncbi:class I SAM-dependent methyltransferase [Synergistaceae bacterium OttesenSCG-928-D05]|nr:class I SAM-dependent methyltransferase [Synergistaceae bacterium OttesenSCG-928-D05]